MSGRTKAFFWAMAKIFALVWLITQGVVSLTKWAVDFTDVNKNNPQQGLVAVPQISETTEIGWLNVIRHGHGIEPQSETPYYKVALNNNTNDIQNVRYCWVAPEKEVGDYCRWTNDVFQVYVISVRQPDGTLVYFCKKGVNFKPGKK
jgi:hypothetical protein